MSEKKDFNTWINQIANTNGYIELADNTEVIEDIGYYVLLKYPNKEEWRFIFHHKIQN